MDWELCILHRRSDAYPYLDWGKFEGMNNFSRLMNESLYCECTLDSRFPRSQCFFSERAWEPMGLKSSSWWVFSRQVSFFPCALTWEFIKQVAHPTRWAKRLIREIRMTWFENEGEKFFISKSKHRHEFWCWIEFIWSDLNLFLPEFSTFPKITQIELLESSIARPSFCNLDFQQKKYEASVNRFVCSYKNDGVFSKPPQHQHLHIPKTIVYLI